MTPMSVSYEPMYTLLVFTSRRHFFSFNGATRFVAARKLGKTLNTDLVMDLQIAGVIQFWTIDVTVNCKHTECDTRSSICRTCVRDL